MSIESCSKFLLPAVSVFLAMGCDGSDNGSANGISKQACDGGIHGETQTRTAYESEWAPFGTTCTSEPQSRECADGTWTEWTGTFLFDGCDVADENATCDDSTGVWMCECVEGFEGEATDCNDVDGCAEDSCQGMTCTDVTAPDTGHTCSHCLNRASATGCGLATVDENGNVVANSNDSDCDGEPDNSCREYIYDTSNNLLALHLDMECDGPPYTNCGTYTYDASGNKLAQQKDADCNGTPDANCREYTYDENGNMLTQQIDPECDGGPFTNCAVWTYDEIGNTLTRVNDAACNGVFTNCSSWTYDVLGDNVSEQNDSDCDGIPDDDCVTYAWKHQATGTTKAENRDLFCDGQSVECRTLMFDPDGNMLSSEKDVDCDGIPDSDCRTWTYDSDGNPLTGQNNADCDGPPDTECFAATFLDGEQLSYEQDTDCDGTVDAHSCHDYTYQ